MSYTCYAEKDKDAGGGYYKVTFLVNNNRAVLTRSFDSPYLARLFVNKLKHSTRCTLLSYPVFS